MNKTLSVLVPVFNEAPHLKVVVERLMKVSFSVPVEFIFINDGSTDGSREILDSLCLRYGCKVIHKPSSRGKGAALRTGLDSANGELILFQDADFEYDPNDIQKLLEPILESRADVVYGSRFKQGNPYVHRTYHYLANKILTVLSNMMSGIFLTDMETCYKLVPRELLQAMNLKSSKFGIEVEVTAYLAKTTARIFEVPISYQPRSRLEGKKITWRDGVAALMHLIRFNLLTSDTDAFKEIPEKYRSRN